MKTTQFLFASLILAVSSLMLVQAATEGTSIDSSEDNRNIGEILFQGRCQMCHQLPEPGMLKPKQWKLILAVMQQRMQQGGIPPLTDEETERVFTYLAERAR